MRNIVVQILEKHPFLYNILLVLKYRHDSDFMNEIKRLRKNSNLIELQENRSDKENSGYGEVWCDVLINGANEGFFALVRWTLDALYFCDCFGLHPFIRFSNDCLYHDIDMPSDKNVYDYYFEQPFLKDSKLLENAKSFIMYKTRNGLKAEMLNGGVSYQVTEDYIIQMAKIMKKYLKFNEETMTIISRQIKMQQINEKVLGVHIRGTDYKSNYKNHPQYILPQLYYKYIDEAIAEYGFEKIYLATDDSDILNEFLNQYEQGMVIFSKDALRGEGNQGIHTISGVERLYHKYKLGIEVICDMCALAACGGLISGLSQVGLIARIYKKSKDESFLYDKRISSGVNKDGNYFKIASN